VRPHSQRKCQKHYIFIALRLLPALSKPLPQNYRVILCNPFSQFGTLFAANPQIWVVKKVNPLKESQPSRRTFAQESQPSMRTFGGRVEPFERTFPSSMGRSRPRNKLPYLLRVFSSRRGLHTGDHIYAPGPQRGNSFGNILRIQPAGGHETLQRFGVLE